MQGTVVVNKKFPFHLCCMQTKCSVPVHGTNTLCDHIRTTNVFYSTIHISVCIKKFRIRNCVYGKTSTIGRFDIGWVEWWIEIKRAEMADFHICTSLQESKAADQILTDLSLNFHRTFIPHLVFLVEDESIRGYHPDRFDWFKTKKRMVRNTYLMYKYLHSRAFHVLCTVCSLSMWPFYSIVLRIHACTLVSCS